MRGMDEQRVESHRLPPEGSHATHFSPKGQSWAKGSQQPQIPPPSGSMMNTNPSEEPSGSMPVSLVVLGGTPVVLVLVHEFAAFVGVAAMEDQKMQDFGRLGKDQTQAQQARYEAAQHRTTKALCIKLSNTNILIRDAPLPDGSDERMGALSLSGSVQVTRPSVVLFRDGAVVSQRRAPASNHPLRTERKNASRAELHLFRQPARQYDHRLSGGPTGLLTPVSSTSVSNPSHFFGEFHRHWNRSPRSFPVRRQFG